ncbi:APC family permease [Mycolicibacterium aubagnense]|uniref:Amino acid permease n=1 Tax=Mycolicibacterium aubagnense TaxID=319707 RepID=A0ABN5YUI2_9MYCO|nr:APC family permease [Mycolicibacterium aubagnense]TLH49690.1 amino acid permease [Mycolicibacterium aubagnense]WGI32888.1 APC family permease [Mycolicibacterium aubagnense]BBX85441.1 amino acid permease [Mycolicibacterium aubagnense]
MTTDARSTVGAPTADLLAAGGSVDRLRPNALGLIDVIFMAVATSAPITAMSGNVPFAVGFGVGTGAPATYIFATIVLTVFAVGYVAMARHVTSTGAFYGFVSHGLGRVVGLAVGYMVTFCYSAFEASLIGIFAYFGNKVFLDQIGLNIPWPYFAFACILLNAILAFFDISFAAKVLSVLLITEIAILAVMAVAVLTHGGGPDGLMPQAINPANAFKANGLALAAPGLAMFIAFWSWTGFESTVMYGEESRNPRKIIPIATLIAVTGVGLFYIFVSWMTVAGNGAAASIERAQSANPLDMFFHPTEVFVGHWAVLVFQWLMMTGSFACGLAFHNCAARYGYALGREGLLPRALGRTHPKHGSPYIASYVQMVIAALWILGFWLFKKDPYLDVFVLLAVVGTFSLLIVQTITMAAVFNYFRHHHPGESVWRVKVAPVVGGLGMLAVVILMIQNLDTAAGSAASSLLFKLIPYIAIVLFVIGCAVALYLKRADPAKYQLIGRVVLATDGHGPVYDADEEGDGPAEGASATTASTDDLPDAAPIR